MIVALNLKSNFTKSEMIDYVQKYQQLSSNEHQLIVCPSSCYLPYFSNVNLGAQDISCYEQGSYTGEISGAALKSLGVHYVLIHHSERLKYQKESIEITNQKLKMAKQYQMIPIICVGDTKEDVENNRSLGKIKEELAQLELDSLSNYMIAYEPIYAIGTGEVPKNNQIQMIISAIKELYPVPILYGGSVNDKNVIDLKHISGLDGFLLGNISLDIEALQRLLINLNEM